uniref:HIG1 domain-containing protein n=3 Tax=Setaria TaxID=4554 RepID=K3YWQ6_SETIT
MLNERGRTRKRQKAKIRRKEEEENAKQMAEGPSKMESMRKWVVEHKLRAVGCLWLTGISSSIAYNWSRPNMKPSVKIIHARLHAQALTLAALVGSACVEYYDNKYGSSGPKVDKYTSQYLAHSHKD